MVSQGGTGWQDTCLNPAGVPTQQAVSHIPSPTWTSASPWDQEAVNGRDMAPGSPWLLHGGEDSLGSDALAHTG